MLNKIILIGRLAADPEKRATATGKPVTVVRLATNTYAGKAADGTRREITDFHRLVLFGGLAEFAAGRLRKGALVYVEGRNRTRSWESEPGERRYITEVVVVQLNALSPVQVAA